METNCTFSYVWELLFYCSNKNQEYSTLHGSPVALAVCMCIICVNCGRVLYACVCVCMCVSMMNICLCLRDDLIFVLSYHSSLSLSFCLYQHSPIIILSWMNFKWLSYRYMEIYRIWIHNFFLYVKYFQDCGRVSVRIQLYHVWDVVPKIRRT